MDILGILGSAGVIALLGGGMTLNTNRSNKKVRMHELEIQRQQNEKINELEHRKLDVDAHEKSVTALTGVIETLQRQLNEREGDLTELQTNLDKLTAQRATHLEQIEQLNGKISSLNDEIRRLKEQLRQQGLDID